MWDWPGRPLPSTRLRCPRSGITFASCMWSPRTPGTWPDSNKDRDCEVELRTGNQMQTNRAKARSTVQIDNERVVVTEWRFAPGAETGWHRHMHDYVVVPLTDGDLELETPDGLRISALKKGSSYTRTAGVEHNVINANEFEFAFVEIELVGAPH